METFQVNVTTPYLKAIIMVESNSAVKLRLRYYDGFQLCKLHAYVINTNSVLFYQVNITDPQPFKRLFVRLS